MEKKEQTKKQSKLEKSRSNCAVSKELGLDDLSGFTDAWCPPFCFPAQGHGIGFVFSFPGGGVGACQGRWEASTQARFLV